MNLFKIENQPVLKSGFVVPENYFDNFSAKIIAKTPKQGRGMITVFKRKKAVFLAVAAVLFFALMLPFGLNLLNSKELDAGTLENYLVNQTNLNQYDLVSGEINNISTKKHTPEDEAVEDILIGNANIEHLVIE